LIAGLVAVTTSFLGVVAFADRAAAASGGGCAGPFRLYAFPNTLGYIRTSPCISASGSYVYSDSYTDFTHNTISWRSCTLKLTLERDGMAIASVTKDCTYVAQHRWASAYFVGPMATNSGTHTYQLKYDISGWSTEGVYHDEFPIVPSKFQYMP
jgi:hypothetical protein